MLRSPHHSSPSYRVPRSVVMVGGLDTFRSFAAL
jgi:hypothetical protein